MSLFRVLKYSSLVFFFNRYRGKIFRIVAVVLFAVVTSILYQDVADYLQAQHPGTVVYALIGKIIIVYGALVFVLWQFRPEPKTSAEKLPDTPPEVEPPPPNDRLSALEDIESHDKLKTRYDRIISKK